MMCDVCVITGGGSGMGLGYHTRSYAETIRDEVRWLKAEGLA